MSHRIALAALAVLTASAVHAQEQKPNPAAPTTGQEAATPAPKSPAFPPDVGAPAAAPAAPSGRTPIEGCVVVAFHILVNGEPVEMEVTDSVPKGRFDSGAMKGLEKWRFGPQPKCEGRYWQKLEFRTNPPGPPAERACLEPPAPDCKVRPPAPPK